MTAVVQYRGRGSVCASCAWFAPGLRQGLRKVCAKVCAWFARKVVSSKRLSTVLYNGL